MARVHCRRVFLQIGLADAIGGVWPAYPPVSSARYLTLCSFDTGIPEFVDAADALECDGSTVLYWKNTASSCGIVSTAI